jgi:hypothetical protein
MTGFHKYCCYGLSQFSVLTKSAGPEVILQYECVLHGWDQMYVAHEREMNGSRNWLVEYLPNSTAHILCDGSFPQI